MSIHGYLQVSLKYMHVCSMRTEDIVGGGPVREPLSLLVTKAERSGRVGYREQGSEGGHYLREGR